MRSRAKGKGKMQEGAVCIVNTLAISLKEVLGMFLSFEIEPYSSVTNPTPPQGLRQPLWLAMNGLKTCWKDQGM